ncbi:YhcN/YlaJ family sporulation lipoprotein [Paenibacillus paridis]|uniref:YhcN/YlaJ family sporulation lipoprotein n=1 Tax=Paenibacillus paridis TaxID=2583376 RepID=UPI001120F2D9|nr:YhcN/YlaJ family sporulation lipoprotein [Paenibacillus paridis]
MKKHLKPVITSVMVLAIGFSMSACSQNHTVKQQSMKARNEMHRIESKAVPYGTNMTDRRINEMDYRTRNSTYNGMDNMTGNNRMYNNMNNGTGIDNTMENRMGNSTYNRMHGMNTKQSADQLASRARSVSGVKMATVVVHNNEAIVGLDIDNKGKKAIIEKQVYAALKGQYPAYNIHVTSDHAMHQKIQKMNAGMSSNHPIKTLANDVTMMIRDIGNAVTAPLR